MSKFHVYSLRNIQLILKQNPNATHIASFKKWKKDFERHVKRSEKAIYVMAPIIEKLKDPETGKIILDEDGNEKTTVLGYRLVPVFDVSQTDGKELAKPVYELEGSHENYTNLYQSAKEVLRSQGVSIDFREDLGQADGYYSIRENRIVLKKGMSASQTLSTLFHEMAHADLHNLESEQKNTLSRSTKELQAESVAFVVSHHYGIDTSGFSFGYLANWTTDPEGLSDLENQMKIVQKEAKLLDM